MAIVTGGSRGIGAASCTVLASRGFDVAVAYRRQKQAGQAVAGRCRAFGQRAVALPLDVAAEEEVVRFFSAVDDELGPPAVLINAAGIVDRKARVDELTAARIEHMLSVNVLGSFLCAREAVLRMSSRQGGSGGSIVNVSSAAARLGSPSEYVDYAASKGAIDTMTVGLACEVAAEGIRVNAVRPGLIDTDIHASGGQPDRLERLAPLIPMARGGTAEEVAHTIAWRFRRRVLRNRRTDRRQRGTIGLGSGGVAIHRAR
jgi:NAD(P)-dependent dehydrogenase (short-subunit alcohol dehydrogenase family)